jgi:8-oxo-dGTP pyrophosphatase MutT (NUDIX family)
VGTLSRRVLHTGRIGSFGIEEVELPSGRRCTLDVLKHPGAAAAVLFTGETRVVLLRQWRHAAGLWLWEIPAGKLDPGEGPDECIAREIEEETGWRARTIEKLGVMVPAPAYTDERIWLYEARDVEAGTGNLDDDEEIEVHEFEFDEALAMIARGEILDAKTIAGLHLVSARRGAPASARRRAQASARREAPGTREAQRTGNSIPRRV